MNPQIEAAGELGVFFDQQNIRYVIIGGVAVQFWGSARFTEDLDCSIATPLIEGSAGIVELITKTYPSRVENPQEFARRVRLILVTASNNVTVDISLAFPGYEDELFARAKEFEISPGRTVKVCSAEDLIIHKAIAGRPRDLEDIQGVIYRHKDTLDTRYIKAWLSEFSALYETDQPTAIFKDAWAKR